MKSQSFNRKKSNGKIFHIINFLNSKLILKTKKTISDTNTIDSKDSTFLFPLHIFSLISTLNVNHLENEMKIQSMMYKYLMHEQEF